MRTNSIFLKGNFLNFLRTFNTRLSRFQNTCPSQRHKQHQQNIYRKFGALFLSGKTTASKTSDKAPESWQRHLVPKCQWQTSDKTENTSYWQKNPPGPRRRHIFPSHNLHNASWSTCNSLLSQRGVQSNPIPSLEVTFSDIPRIQRGRIF